tara:strand:+ start:1207 stop:1671 length:465 start_codon:yes stop_codon:yes gene_type:complete
MQTKYIFVIILSLFFSGCETIRPTFSDCTHSITAVEEGTRVTLRTLDNGDTAQASLNGVSALCNERVDTIDIKMKVGLKLVRKLDQNVAAVELELPLIIAILDSNDKVKSYESVSYKMAFPENKSTIYPVIKPKTKMPINGRAIITLAPKIVKP